MASTLRSHVGVEVEDLAAAPDVPGQSFHPLKTDVLGERRAGVREDFLEHRAHREDRRAQVDHAPADRRFAHLSAGRRRGFEHGDCGASGGQQCGRCKAAHSGSDDHDPLLVHAKSEKAIDLHRQMCK